MFKDYTVGKIGAVRKIKVSFPREMLIVKKVEG
jgi:hypothetical protein